MDKSSTIAINGKSVVLEWTRSADRALVERNRPLVVELELYFSCLVKKFVRFHDEPAGGAAVGVNDKLMLRFRSVTSTACTMEAAERLGRQPEIELDTAVSKRFAPRRIRLDYHGNQWQGEFWM
jgi:hypothetical protein